MKRGLGCMILALFLLTGCMGSGNEIVLPDRTPAVQPEQTVQSRDLYLVVGHRLLGMRTADGRWLAADRLPEDVEKWVIFGGVATEAEHLPAELPGDILAVSGEGFEAVRLTPSAWEPATDLLYALIRTVTGTEPLSDPPQVTLLGSLSPESGVSLRLLEVRGSYSLLVQERDGAYEALPGVSGLLGVWQVAEQTVLLCADEAGSPVLLGYGSGGWHQLLPVD